MDPHLPSLTLHLAVAPGEVMLGDTVALTLTVTNGADDPANQLVVTLPTPDGAAALPGPNTIGLTKVGVGRSLSWLPAPPST